MRRQTLSQNNKCSLTETKIYEILSNERRQLVLRILREANGEMGLRELAETIAEAEARSRPDKEKNVQSVYITLYQSHLPKLVDFGVVEYDGEAVRLTDRAEDIKVHLETGPEPVVPSSGVYLGIALSGIVTVLGSYVGLPVLGGVPPAVWATVHFVLIGGVAVYQASKRRNPSQDVSGGG